MSIFTPNWQDAADILTDMARVSAVLDRLEFSKEIDGITEYTALCPAHDDHTPSLFVAYEPSNKKNPIRMHCRAGCPFERIVYLVRERERTQGLADDEAQEMMTPPFTPTEQTSTQTSFFEATQYSPLYHLAGYCGVSYAWLKDNPDLTLAEDVTTGWVHFVFVGVEGERPGLVLKGRKMPPGTGEKTHEEGWSNLKKPAPPFFPIPPKELPEEFATTEGETDMIYARSIGFPAYSLTCGATTPLDTSIARTLKDRGVKRWLIFADQDTAGKSCRDNIIHICLDVGITPIPVDLSLLSDPLLGGRKDLRDHRHLFASPEEAHQAIRGVIAQSEARLDDLIPNFESAYAQRSPDPGWLVEDIVAPGTITVLTGKPGQGKTSILMALCAAARHGTSLLGKEVRAHRILFVTEEGVRSLWKKREIYGAMAHVRLFSLDYGDLGDNPDDAASVVRILADVARRHEVQTIIIDPAFSFLRPSDDDRAAEVRPIFRKLRALSREGFGVLVTLHSRKSAATGGGIDVIAGSIVIPGESDIALSVSLAADGDPTHRQLEWLKSRLNQDIVAQPPLTITTEDDHLIIVDGPPDRDRQIMDFLGDQQWHTTADIASFLACTQDDLRRPLEHLCHQGTLVKEKCDGQNGKRSTWRYRMPVGPDFSGLKIH